MNWKEKGCIILLKILLFNLKNTKFMSSVVLYSNAVKLKTQIYEDVHLLSQTYNQSQAQQLSASISRLDSLINELNSLARKQMQPEKREMQLSRVTHLRQEWSDLKQQFDNQRQTQTARLQSENRQSLLGNQENQLHYRNQNESTFLDMDLREQQALDNAETHIEQYIVMGRNALNELYDQRSMMKSTQKRLLDAAAKLGLSSTVMRFIEQRSSADRWILLGLVMASTFILWAIVHYLG
jgi:Golgi SNAP receptor complex protein 2